ncbi:MAG TPA: hypothetical protein VFN66_07730 [Burkholderiales bacterium]|nr:hypothetical protein [Burkholderiales bacterium]
MSPTEKNLLSHFRRLDAAHQQTAMDFVEFLAGRSPAATSREIVAPVEIPRPEHESVIKAVKRLRATYPMLEPGKLLNDTSTQMTRHVIHGVAVEEVIDELENVFKRHYELYLAKFDSETS